MLGISQTTLKNWSRRQDIRIPFVRVGARIRYRLEDVERFIAAYMVLRRRIDASPRRRAHG